MKNKINIGLVDDDLLLLEGLHLLLSSFSKLNITLSTRHPETVLEQLAVVGQNDFPDVLLIDIKMEPLNGFQLVEIVKEKYPAIKIIVLSSYYRQTYLGQMVKLGVSSFLPKNLSKELLFEAIEKVEEHGVFFTEQDQAMIIGYLQRKKSKYEEELVFSPRELEVIELICQEYTNQEIADALFLSKRTVETHRQRILERIGAKNTVGLVVYAVVNQLYRIR
ncbi:response regulator transcription factor [Myroides sp. 1354]|uniref:response regulator transcription factor n=1 Tax=unclassified Myroides TaxID=2642485 RepID=UPI0025763245|nr:MULTISPECIES: response regulator transcription factor [unclassified Myroides]MDM1046146.1 response regulator transcription factor [Myroides sp. R163-1]MDM1057138.1 response regulator transcription factor [Myroides sp. 1354]MDM1070277.1 response regulator transcription factor [Myroides sp. 1372]